MRMFERIAALVALCLAVPATATTVNFDISGRLLMIAPGAPTGFAVTDAARLAGHFDDSLGVAGPYGLIAYDLLLPSSDFTLDVGAQSWGPGDAEPIVETEAPGAYLLYSARGFEGFYFSATNADSIHFVTASLFAGGQPGTYLDRAFLVGGEGPEAFGIFGVIPEPGTWATMIAGFGLTGAFARRRRRGTAAA